MKEVIGFIRQYYRDVNKTILAISSVFIALLVWLNYAHGLENRLLYEAGLPWSWATAHWLIYQVAFFFPYLLLFVITKKAAVSIPRSFVACLLAAPLLFAIKVGMDTSMPVSDRNDWNLYWNSILYWPPRLLVLLILLGLTHRFFNPEPSFYGIAPKKVQWKPYLYMLLIMIPLIAAASTQPDFLASYPKMRDILPLPDDAHPTWVYKLLYELSYGSDFIAVEVFFRGFLVIGFIKWAGKDAILPMACFYCTIHFGKPMGECISSYFGGMLLGIVSYHTRSIYGGLMVHLGIAWLMEIGGYIGNRFLI